MKIMSPCYECERRSTSCWDKCDDYKAYKEKLKEAKERDIEYRRNRKYGWENG